MTEFEHNTMELEQEQVSKLATSFSPAAGSVPKKLARLLACELVAASLPPPKSPRSRLAKSISSLLAAYGILL